MAVSSDVRAALERLAGLRALVVGDAMLDTYLYGSTDRICQEAPVPVVSVADRADAPGGAANTAVNARALGASVTLLSAAGDDGEGRALRRVLENGGVPTSTMLIEPGRRTLAKQRIVAGSQLLLRVDQGRACRMAPAAEAELARRLSALAVQCDAIVISDYGYGVLGPRMIEALSAIQERAPRVLVVDSKALTSYRSASPTAVKPNYLEAARLLGGLRGAGPRGDAVARRGRELLQITGARIAAVTLDAEGALFFEEGRAPYRTYARPAEACSATGAGDTFAAALALALAAGAGMEAAAEIASAAAAVVVAKEGTATCSLSELEARVAGVDKVARSATTILPVLERCRRAGLRVVLTSGCFDLLHRGHIALLDAAKALGDVLVVGLNTDASVRRIKGEGRPINPLEDRAQVLAGLSCVDHVVAFDEDTPERLVTLVRPSTFVKGGDYTAESLPEARAVEACGGRVRILPYVEDRSTTSIIKQIRASEDVGRRVS